MSETEMPEIKQSLYVYSDEIENIKHRIKKRIDHQRYIHTLGVAYTAASLAMCHGYSMEKAYLAGLLHDCAKCIPDDKKIEKCKKHNIVITDTEYKAPYLLHSKLGAYYAASKYGVNDKEILDAVTYHTTGRADMTVPELILFIADYIEPGRNKAARLDVIRKTAFEDLELCAYMILEDTVNYLSGKNSRDTIDATTISAYNFYKEKLSESENKQ